MTSKIGFEQLSTNNVIVMEARSLDFNALVTHQQLAFSEIIEKTGTRYLFDRSYYMWKYSPPAGEAKIAMILDADGILATNSMYPLDILAGEKRIRGWQSCDTATHPRGRGKGYFMKCIEALTAQLEPNAVFFGYPNHNSKPGLVKCGWTHHDDLRTWARLLPGRKTTKFRFIEPIQQFTAEQDDFSRELASRGSAMIERSAIQMNWRYNQHPLHHYEKFGWREEGRLLGVIVLRRAKIAGKKLAIIMEILSLFPHIERGMLSFAAGWARKQKVTYTVALNNTIQPISGILTGYAPIPMWMLPKRQILMGRATGDSQAKVAWSMPWNAQMGDWDAF